MLKDYRFLCSEINQGKSVLRAFLNLRLTKECIKGQTLDVGGGGGSDYIDFVKRTDDVNFETFDLKVGKKVDFEKDALPINDDFYETVLFLNVMEHIFNYQHIANEVVRIIKPKGRLIGFVPFLMWYHPDHRDFFRYTHEALYKIFNKAGITDVKIEAISKGPFCAACHIILLSFPRLLRLPIFTVMYVLDNIFLFFRKNAVGKFALGYLFIGKK